MKKVLGFILTLALIVEVFLFIGAVGNFEAGHYTFWQMVLQVILSGIAIVITGKGATLFYE